MPPGHVADLKILLTDVPCPVCYAGVGVAWIGAPGMVATIQGQALALAPLVSRS